MAYTNGPINRLNYKGIIKSDSTKKVIRPKIAYYAMQNVTSIFDNSLERISNLNSSYNITSASVDEHRYQKGTDRSVSVYGYKNKTTQKQLYTIWMDENIPSNTNTIFNLTLSFTNANFDNPVLVDIITGAVYQIPESQWSKKGNTYTFRDMPIYDAPIVIADKSLINFKEMKISSTSFLMDAELPWEDLGGGVSRQVMGYNGDLMLVKIKFKKGGIGALHQHIHSQTAYVASGVFELTINGDKKILKAGDGYFVQPNIEHGAVCLEEGILIDAFNPMRKDFLK
jgi:quercetin dioxygenase-like cupin family protein